MMSNQNNHPSCETCGTLFSGDDTAHVRNLPGEAGPVAPEYAYTANGYRILRCPICGLHWTDVPADFQSDELYEEDFFQGKSPNGYFDYLGTADLLDREFQDRAKLVKKFRAAGSLLDVGCANGNFIKAAQHFFTVKGIDVSSFAVQAAQREGLPAVCGSLLELEKIPQSYDAITLFDTLEHVPNPAEILGRSFFLLKKDGVVVISTGDMSSLMGRLTGKRWRLMTPPEHLWFFNRHNLSVLLERCGFKVLDCQYTWRRVPVSLMWFQVFRGRQKPLPDWIGKIALPVNLFDAMTMIAIKNDG